MEYTLTIQSDDDDWTEETMDGLLDSVTTLMRQAEVTGKVTIADESYPYRTEVVE